MVPPQICPVPQACVLLLVLQVWAVKKATHVVLITSINLRSFHHFNFLLIQVASRESSAGWDGRWTKAEGHQLRTGMVKQNIYRYQTKDCPMTIDQAETKSRTTKQPSSSEQSRGSGKTEVGFGMKVLTW